MTIIVEDGSGVTGANSYASVDVCAAYCTARGLAFGTSPTTTGEQALIRATAAIDAKYGPRFPGSRTNGRSQALAWPRVDAVDGEDEDIASDEIPVEIVNAVCEAAVRELASPGSMAPDLERGGGVKSLKAGSVAIEYGANAAAGTTFTVIDGILASLLGAGESVYSAKATRG